MTSREDLVRMRKERDEARKYGQVMRERAEVAENAVRRLELLAFDARRRLDRMSRETPPLEPKEDQP